MEAKTLFCGEDGGLERVLGEGQKVGEGDEFVGIALDEDRSYRRNAEREVFEAEEESEVWRRGESECRSEAEAVDDFDVSEACTCGKKKEEGKVEGMRAASLTAMEARNSSSKKRAV